MHQNVLVSQPQTGISQKTRGRNAMSRKDRLFRVQVGVAAGKSNRQIAKQLGVDEATVRRDRLTLLLSKEDLQAVRAGAAVEPLLQKQEHHKAATAREKQEALERESQFLTNRLAELIDRWLSKFSMIGVDKLHVVIGVDRWSWEFQTPKGICIPDSKIDATIESVKPKADNLSELFALIEYAKEWLFRWIVLIEPDREIRNRALTKVRQELERHTPHC
jgi:transposase